MAYFIGTVLGASVAIYLLSRIIELILIRIIKNPSTIIIVSTSIIFICLLTLWLSALGKPQAQGISSLLAYFFASIFLAFFRCRKKTGKSVETS